MNHGVLFRAGQEQQIRKWLVESDILEAVIDIPRNLFYATTIPNSVFVFNKNKPRDRRGQVLFIDGTKRFQEGKKINDMSEQDINTIVEACRAGVEIDNVRCRCVQDSELKENDYSFNFGVYLPSTGAAESVDPAQALANWQQAHRVAEEARIKMEDALR
jgi:type I restriction enzyme M protein